MIAAIYARKSTEQNGASEDAKSVTRQIEHAKAYAAKKGWTVADEHIYCDDGISGAEFDARRPGLKHLMDALSPRPSFQVLIVSEESRLGREQIEVASLLKQLSVAGVVVHCYLDGTAVRLDTPTDKMMVALRGFSDENERTRAAQRTYDGMARLARAAHVTGGRCFGYTNFDVTAPTPDAHGRPIRLYVDRCLNEAQAAVVRRIFKLYAEGKGFGTIAKLLNEESAPCPRPSPGRPHGWAPASVRQVLLRPIYKGEILWNKTKKRDQWGRRLQRRRDESEWMHVPAEHLRIVPDDLWQAVHDRLQDIRKSYLRANNGQLLGRPINGIESKYLLTGMAACTLCKPPEEGALYGGSLTPRSRAHGRHRAFFYACMTHVLRGRRKCGNDLHLPMEATHRAVWESLKGTVFQRDVLLYSVEKAIEREKARQAVAEDSGHRTALEEQLDAVEQELARLTAAIAAGGEMPALLAAIQEREGRRAQLQRGLDSQSALYQMSSLDLRLLDRELKAKIADWTRLLDSIGGNVSLARQLLRKLLAGKLAFTPDLEARVCTFTGRSSVGQVLQGLVPAKGMVSPTGFEPVLSA